MKDNYFDFAVNSARWLSVDDFEGEIWKDANGLVGLYLVSNYGRVKTLPRKIPCKGRYGQNSYKTVKEKIKVCLTNNRGYLFVTLSINNRTFRKYVHRIVAETFLPNPLGCPQVNHKDENKTNNSVYNLEWCTAAYNNNYGTAKSRARTTKEKNGKLRGIDVYDTKGNFLKYYTCAYDMEKDGLNRRSVYAVCDGRNRSHKGLVFRYHGEPFSYRDINRKRGCQIPVYKYDSSGNLVAEYISIKHAERENGFGRNYLYSCSYARTRRPVIDGYIYSFTRI